MKKTAIEALPLYMRMTQYSLDSFPETKHLPNKKELNYSYYALLVAYIIGGNRENFLAARKELLDHYLK